MTEVEKELYINQIREHGLDAIARKVARVSRQRVDKAVEKDLEFGEQVSEARDLATDALIKEARRRALDGIEEPVFYQGIECGSIKKYSDSLMTKLLTGYRPEVFGDKREISTPGGGGFNVIIQEFSKDEDNNVKVKPTIEKEKTSALTAMNIILGAITDEEKEEENLDLLGS